MLKDNISRRSDKTKKTNKLSHLSNRLRLLVMYVTKNPDSELSSQADTLLLELFRLKSYLRDDQVYDHIVGVTKRLLKDIQ